MSSYYEDSQIKLLGGVFVTDEQKLLMQLTGYDDDMHLMNCIWEMDLKMEELRRGYYQKLSKILQKRFKTCLGI